MGEWKKVKLKEILKQYRNTHWVEDKHYKQVTISQTGEVSYRGTKHGSQIGRKRQFIIDLKNHPNTLIFIRQGVYKGGIGICPKEVDGCLVTENMPMFDIVGVNPEYLIYYLKSPQFKNDVDKLVPLGTAQKAVHENQLLEIELFLPSLKEQEEIVKKVKSNSRGILELDNINNKNENYITKLRQQILQEAVQGKLVKQDPKDEPALELLKKIKAEKEKLIKEGKIRKEKPLKPISEDEIPYELPREWAWVKLGELTTIKGGKRVPNGYQLLTDPTSHIYIRVTDMKNGTIDDSNLRYISNTVFNDIKNYIISKEDLYITIAGTIGQVGEVPEKFHEMNLTENAARIILYKINKRFLSYALSSKVVQEQFSDKTKQMAQPKLALERINSTLFPLPPLAEQKRIVEKVDKLMAYCDELERQVKENQGNSEKLMVAVLKESFQNG